MRNIAATVAVLMILSACGGGSGNQSGVVAPEGSPTPVGTQIEFLIQGTQLGSGNDERTNIEVRAPNYAGACIVRVAGVCGTPTSVKISVVSGLNLGRTSGQDDLTLNEFDQAGKSVSLTSVIGLNQPNGPPYVGVLYASYQWKQFVSLVKATVTATAPNGDTVQREGFVLTNFSQPFEAGFLGGSQSVQIKPSIGTLFTPGAANPRTGTVVIDQGTMTGDSANVQYAYSLAAAPAGSAASMELDPASNTGHFTPDKAGEYVVALTPVYADGRTAYPAYDLIRVEQASTAVAVNITSTPNPPALSPFLFVSPLAAENTSRIYVHAARNGLVSNVVSVQGELDGVVLGTLPQPNATITTCFRLCGADPFFAFDIPQAQLVSSSHTFVATVTTNKAEQYRVTLNFLGAGAGEANSQEFAAAPVVLP